MMKGTRGVQESQLLEAFLNALFFDIKKIHNTSRAQLDLDDEGKTFLSV
jgi:hypothetical protein